MADQHARIDYEAFTDLAPAAHAALLALGKAVDATGLDKSLTELVKLHVSQRNGCAFCVQYHLTIARKLGIASPKLDLVAAWRDAGVYSERELAALAWADCLTDVATKGAPDPVYSDLRQHFSEAETVALTIAIAAISSWNRLGIGLRFAPPLPRNAMA